MMTMDNRDLIKVIIVDDSLVFREWLSRGISADPDIRVVGKAKDPFEARDLILEHSPNMMICDINMPRMNGIEFIRRLLPQYALPVIVVSDLSSAVFDALNAGAVDFMTKPDAQLSNLDHFMRELIVKIKVAARAKVVINNGRVTVQPPKTDRPTNIEMIAVAASTGGTQAISALLHSLPNTIPGMVVVQHIPPHYSRMFAERLNASSPFRVKEAQSGDVVEKGTVLIAPGGQHMRVRKKGDQYKVECFYGDLVNGHRPSADVLFDSVAREAGDRAVGIILTGMGYDGAKGLLAMKRRGARTIGQDEQSSVVYGMPKVACEIGAVERQAPLSRIPVMLCDML